MRVLDLFAGLRGWSEPAVLRGHEVISIDYDPRFDVTFHHDLTDVSGTLALLGDWRPDLVLASPPCEGFTVMNIGKNWTRPTDDPPHFPRTDVARLGLRIVAATLALIEDLGPMYWVMENPRAKLRKLPLVAPFERRTVTYCQFGEVRMKPTDLWGGFPPSLVLPAPCQNGDPCHVRAPRGSRTPGSTQGIKGSADRAEIPEGLAYAIITAAEQDLLGAHHPVPTTLWDRAFIGA